MLDIGATEAGDQAGAAVDLVLHDTQDEQGREGGGCCWIYFTSGTSGKPKGVACAHEGAINYCRNHPLIEPQGKSTQLACVHRGHTAHGKVRDMMQTRACPGAARTHAHVRSCAM
jgi:hypothetical protein